jgi:hypothetical protein
MINDRLFAILFIAGSVAGCLSVLMSYVWHVVDARLSEMELEGEETFEEMDERWQKKRQARDAIRIVGLWLLYGGMMLMFIGGIRIGLEWYES